MRGIERHCARFASHWVGFQDPLIESGREPERLHQRRGAFPVVNRIFLTMSILANLGLWTTFYLGWSIGDGEAFSEVLMTARRTHFLIALGAATLAMLIHAIVLTYFMGTGRWIEETSQAYRLGQEARLQNIRYKYRVIPGMVGCIALIITTGAFGAIADPGSNSRMAHAATVHFTLAVVTLLLNAIVSYWEYEQIVRNGKLVNAIIDEVRRIRREKGLDIEPASAH